MRPLKTPGRPRQTYGEIAQALRQAAATGPGTARDLCQRAQVGMATGRYTATRLKRSGGLVVVQPGRPAVLGLPQGGQAEPAFSLEAWLHSLQAEHASVTA